MQMEWENAKILPPHPEAKEPGGGVRLEGKQSIEDRQYKQIIYHRRIN
jgi:hypothetical protein